jgi:transcriptional regulator with XRE-family HTH domain
LRANTLSSPGRLEAYQEGYGQAQAYRDTMQLLNTVRVALGISQSELARRLERSQPTVARLLAHGENPTLSTLDQVLRSLGARGRLIIEAGTNEPDENGLKIELADSLPRTSDE